jgi:Mor family transcriptional regulator
MTDIRMDDLPDQAREIADVIGLEDTLRLVSMYGGLVISFSDEGQREVGGRRDIIEKVLGKRARLFFKHFANRTLYVPRCASALKRIRNAQICRDSDAGMSRAELVQKYAPLTERHIWRILKESADKV